MLMVKEYAFKGKSIPHKTSLYLKSISLCRCLIAETPAAGHVSNCLCLVSVTTSLQMIFISDRGLFPYNINCAGLLLAF